MIEETSENLRMRMREREKKDSALTRRDTAFLMMESTPEDEIGDDCVLSALYTSERTDYETI